MIQFNFLVLYSGLFVHIVRICWIRFWFKFWCFDL